MTHHSIELRWDLARTAKQQGPQGQWAQFSIEEEDPRTHTYGVIYMWVPAARAPPPGSPAQLKRPVWRLRRRRGGGSICAHAFRNEDSWKTAVTLKAAPRGLRGLPGLLSRPNGVFKGQVETE